MMTRLALLFALLFALLLALAPAAALADAAPFDLAGPGLEIKVTRAGATLPIAQAPNLEPGDQLWIKADLPPGQSAHYLLVAAFLRGATNPPPKSWFSKSSTWDKKGAGGMTVTVPQGAQQALLFLAPETGGDFGTLVNAVRSRPGAFVRASQDLHQATLDRSRLDAFLAAIRRINETEPTRLKDASPLLARSLTIKLDADCLQKTTELQAPCLVQGRDSLVLNDGHTNSMVQTLTSGQTADLVQQLSYTPRAGAGYYSPYVTSVMDIAHIMDSIRTAHYQYIPTLATSTLANARGDQLALLLNAPPSFQDPKSVLVVALPEVEPPDPPPLHPVDEHEAYCAQKPGLILAVEGAPLVFSTRYAHDLTLRLTAKDGHAVDLPVKADPEKGGLAVDTSGLDPNRFGDAVQATLVGHWGFAAYKGPQFTIQMAKPQRWQPQHDDQQALLAGGDVAVHLRGPGAACVESVTLKPGAAKPRPVAWTASSPDELTVKAPLGRARLASLSLAVKQYGVAQPDDVKLLPADPQGRVDSLEVHAGDTTGVLKGFQLAQVTGVTLGGAHFSPGALASGGAEEELSLKAEGGVLPAAGEAVEAIVAFEDGRTSNLDVTVAAPRPSVSLIEKSFHFDDPAGFEAIQLADKDLAPLGSKLTFSLRAEAPASFRGDEKVEVGGPDGRTLATLTPASGLVFADSQVAIATVDTAKMFNASTAGPLRFRILRGDTPGGWTPLATLVRLPRLGAIKCPPDPKKPCALAGSDLFLIDAVANTPDFRTPTAVPEGFTGSSLDTPRPAAGKLYMKLHDDPAVVNVVTLTPAERAR
ncbi:hypothetical protein [Phenylobacterium sp.]|uniref:hypothetical protein n=1 Tax=Phenylobacterium sp. TaxID=1871053 RepID=UPI00122B4374|nr:hypothetical protein [Phenylobacterium sp.]THD60480.1 MAG: hypothetical protein E8A49_13660 [Phenylobacterium sp.]